MAVLHAGMARQLALCRRYGVAAAKAFRVALVCATSKTHASVRRNRAAVRNAVLD